MARNSRHFWKAGLFAVAAVTVALPPALASMTRADRIRDTQLSNSVLGQFTPASGDPRLIARYIKISEEARRGFSFTPALPDDGHKNRAITVVIRARDDSSSARTAALAAGRTKSPISIAPVTYNLGASVGFENRPTDPAGATDRITAPGEEQTVDVVSSYRLTKNLDVTAGVRYKADDRFQPLTDARRDSQAVYVGTAFRF